jgi:DNA mismatch repair protein MutL
VWQFVVEAFHEHTKTPIFWYHIKEIVKTRGHVSLIQILSNETINRIAAGESIENPASVVKELVENALDAGSTRIFVEIKEGGFQLIRVIDNGCGMSPDDALLSLERHATSKIRDVEDLSSLRTMGFRGEALASIAAISKLSLTTAVKESPGTKIESEGGKVISLAPFPRRQGTTIDVRSIFYNVPARKKFQKSSPASSAEVHRLLIALVLAHPDITFEFVSQEKEVFSFVGHSQGLLRIREVFGEEFGADVRHLNVQIGEYGIQGYLGSPTQSRLNRTGQYTFINHRFVVAPPISFAVKDGYGTRLDADRYPVYILHLDIPPSHVDVNVHPQKRDVRFQQESFLKQMVKEQVEKAFQACMPVRGISLPPQPVKVNDYEEFSTRLMFRETGDEHTVSFFSLKPELQLIGLFHNYLLLHQEGLESFVGKKGEEGVVWIDLLAAEERVIFDSLTKKEEKKLSQGLLIPVGVDMALDEAIEIERRLPEIEKMGFSIRSIGKQSFAVEAIPPFLSAQEIPDVLRSLAGEKEEGNRIVAKFARRRKKIFVLQEALALAEKILQLPGPQLTPSGAPIIAIMSQDEIKQLFQ